jgi:hypothetical protein
MGLGLSGAYGAAEAQKALRVLEQDRQQKELIGLQRIQQEFENSIALQKLTEDLTAGQHSRGLATNADQRAGTRLEKIELPDADRDAAAHGMDMRLKGQTADLGDARMGAINALPSEVRTKALVPNLDDQDVFTPDQLKARGEAAGAASGAASRAAFTGGGKDVIAGTDGPDGLKTLGQLRLINARGAWDQASQRSGMTDSGKFNASLRLQKDWEEASKDARTMKTVVTRMNRAVAALDSGDNSAIPPAAESIQVIFQKILDPTSVVREGEFTRSLLTQPVINRMRGAIDRLVKGGTGIPINELKAYAELANQFTDAANEDAARIRQGTEGMATRHGINPADVFMDDVGVVKAKPKAYAGETPRQTADGRVIGRVDGKIVELVQSGSGWVVK